MSDRCECDITTDDVAYVVDGYMWEIDTCKKCHRRAGFGGREMTKEAWEEYERPYMTESAGDA